MKPLDDELRDALRRERPPAGFAERVLERVASEPAPQDGTLSAGSGTLPPKRPFVRWAAAAAIVAAVAGGAQYRNAMNARAERAAGEAAKEQVIQALRIAADKLQLIQEKVREAGS